MTSVKQTSQWSVWVLAASLLAGCATPAPAPNGHHAPIVDYNPDTKKQSTVPPPAVKPVAREHEQETNAQTYVVQKGDTLYSIAFMHGVDYREVAELNNLVNPAAIQIGQKLRLNVPVATTATKVEIKPVVVQAPAETGGTKSYPKVGKIAYSEQALAQAEQMEKGIAASAGTAPVQKTGTAQNGDDEESLEWGMPTSGKVVAGFSESENRKGVDIIGSRGQAIVASASGKVVYSGSGLRGYGKLIIIKHNKTFLSAYAHNDHVLVKEGQSVTKGQKIAEMGNTDADQVKLHFEIRKLGKPVDPAQYLPLVKS